MENIKNGNKYNIIIKINVLLLTASSEGRTGLWDIIGRERYTSALPLKSDQVHESLYGSPFPPHNKKQSSFGKSQL